MSRSLYVGIVGNMNNNGFAIMRQLHAHQVKADLILFSEDTDAKMSRHFQPEADTREISSFRGSIFSFPKGLGLGALLYTSDDMIDRLIALAIYCIKKICRSETAPIWRVSTLSSSEHEFLKKYSHLIVSSTAPSILARAGFKNTIFMPYAIGIEYYEEHYFRRLIDSSNPIKRYVARRVRENQEFGLSRLLCSFTHETGVTLHHLKRLGVRTCELIAPIVFPPSPSEAIESEAAGLIIRQIHGLQHQGLTVFLSHTRHYWINSSPKDVPSSEWERFHSKHNEWIMHALKSLVDAGKKELRIFLVEYGKDSEATKSLIDSLQLRQYVIWLPLMPRRDILHIIQSVDAGIGEFYVEPTGVGGAQLEFMAQGIPIINGCLPETALAKDLRSFPGFLEADGIESLATHILDLMNQEPDSYSDKAKRKKWYDEKVVQKFINYILDSNRENI